MLEFTTVLAMISKSETLRPRDLRDLETLGTLQPGGPRVSKSRLDPLVSVSNYYVDLESCKLIALLLLFVCQIITKWVKKKEEVLLQTDTKLNVYYIDVYLVYAPIVFPIEQHD